MIIRECRFLTIDDPYDSSIPNWSRRYEWNYALRALRNAPEIKTVLNAACGESEIHGLFVEKLVRLLPDKVIFNTDMRKSEVNKNFPHFYTSDITIQDDEKYDCVVCISTLEELGRKAAVQGTFLNFLEQANMRVILTMDHPSMPLEWLEEMAGQRIVVPENRLTGSNSTWVQNEFSHLSVMLLDVETGNID